MRTSAKLPLLALLAALALLTGACTGTKSDPGAGGGGNEEGGEQGGKPLPSADFQMGEIKVIDSQDRAEAGSKADGENGKIVALVNAYYNAAFIDPTKFADSNHQALKDLFLEEAKGQVDPRIGVLALGDLAKDIDSVKPDSQKIERLTYYFDKDINVPFAIVSVNFEGTATPKQEDAPPIKIRHTGTWWLQKTTPDDYRIQAFNADTNISSQ